MKAWIEAGEAAPTLVTTDVSSLGERVDPRLFSQFFEHMAGATAGGISAELLANATLAASSGLTPDQVDVLIRNESALQAWHAGDPGPLRERWSGAPLHGGFPTGLVERVEPGLPLGWAALGSRPGSARSCPGRIGDGVRIQGETQLAVVNDEVAQLDAVPGLKQGIRIPTHRCRFVVVKVVSRPVSGDGRLEFILRRRTARHESVCGSVGSVLANADVAVTASAWQASEVLLKLPDDAVVEASEVVDLCLRWFPGEGGADLIVDRVSAMPGDHIEGFDPEVIELARQARIPEIRWPGGNFASYYHWRDGVGPQELRPTRPNYSWGGLEQNDIGTHEFLRLCELIGAEPHITVNSGTGSSAEAADWVEYCNGGPETRMGSLRAKNGRPEPYRVHIWEVGNENFGTWQGGYVGSEENARRFAEFAPVMRQASPEEIEIHACGSWFDLVPPSAALDGSVADGRWHDELIRQAPDEIDVVSLHALPVNDQHFDGISEADVHGALMANVVTAERQQIPALLAKLDGGRRQAELPPIRLSITEWGPVGARRDRVRCENAGGGLWGIDFLAMLTRFGERVAMASPNGFLHGGSIKKGGGVVYTDSVFEVTKAMASLAGSRPVRLGVSGPTYDVVNPPDLGLVEHGVPTVGVSAFVRGEELTYVLVSRRLHGSDDVSVAVPDGWRGAVAEALIWRVDDIGLTASPADPVPVTWEPGAVNASSVGFSLQVPARSAWWVTVKAIR